MVKNSSERNLMIFSVGYEFTYLMTDTRKENPRVANKNAFSGISYDSIADNMKSDTNHKRQGKI